MVCFISPGSEVLSRPLFSAFMLLQFMFRVMSFNRALRFLKRLSGRSELQLCEYVLNMNGNVEYLKN